MRKLLTQIRSDVRQRVFCYARRQNALHEMPLLRQDVMAEEGYRQRIIVSPQSPGVYSN